MLALAGLACGDTDPPASDAAPTTISTSAMPSNTATTSSGNAEDPPASRTGSIRFFGTGTDGIDRIVLPIDDPGDPIDGPRAADIGDSDITIEFFLKGEAADNDARDRTCGSNENWIYGNILIDRDRWSDNRKFGVSVVGGRLIVGLSAEERVGVTVCSTSTVVDGEWHHVAIQRRRADGLIQLWVDGRLEAEVDGPDGSLSYPDDAEPAQPNDPFLVLGAEKHDVGPSYPSFAGFLDELRFSDVRRYDAPFPVPTDPFEPDDATRLLLHFDDGDGTTATDSSGHPDGPTDGRLLVGGPDDGPHWSDETPFD